jgi:hypothetical protein
MGAAAGAGVFAGGDGLIGGGWGFMEGLCPSKPPRQRPGGLWKPGIGGGSAERRWWALESVRDRPGRRIRGNRDEERGMHGSMRIGA